MAEQLHIHDRYEFHITAPDGSIWQAFPRVNNLEWRWEENDDWGFKREVLQNDLIFGNAVNNNLIRDFDKLLAIEKSDNRCQFIPIEIKVIINDVAIHRWSGRLRCSAGEWDESYCKLKIKPEVVDAYTCFLDYWEEELDWSESIPKQLVEVKPQYLTNEQTCTWAQSVYPPLPFPEFPFYPPYIPLNIGVEIPLMPSLTEAQVLALVFDEDHCPEWDDAGAAAWSVRKATVIRIRTDSGGLDPSNWIYSYIVKVVFIREIAASTCDIDGPVPPDTDPGWILYIDECPTYSFWVRKPQIIAGQVNHKLFNTYRLWDLLQWFAGSHPLYPNPAVPCGTPIISNYFNINPDATNPDNLAYTKAGAFMSDVHIQHFSDFVKTIDERDEPPQEDADIKFSLKTILENLPGNIGIRMKNGSLLIEHVSYFRRVQMLDLTHPDHVGMILGFNKWKYDKTKLPKLERWRWKNTTDGEGKDFDGVPIKYSGACIDKDSKEAPFDFEIFYSNLKHLFEHKSYYVEEDGKLVKKNDYEDDLDGLIILSVANEKVLYDRCPISGELKLNGHFAISTLHENYYKWDRPLPTGIMNNQPTEFLRWKRQKKQPGIKAHLSVTDYALFDPDDLVKTQMGWGEVDDATFVEMKGILKLELSQH